MTKKIMYVLVSSASVKQGTVMIHSCASTTRVSELMEAAPNALVWQQLYLFKNKLLTQQLIKEAEASGVKALVVTVDAAGGCNRRISPYTEGSREHACNTEFRYGWVFFLGGGRYFICCDQKEYFK